MLTKVNLKAKQVLDTLTQNLEEGHKKIDNGGAGIMAVHVERLYDTYYGPTYSVTHYYEQNGDLMSDPDMVFLKGSTGDYFPLSFQQDNLNLYQEVVAEWTEDMKVKSYRPKLSRELAVFAGLWMKNIKDQQRLSI